MNPAFDHEKLEAYQQSIAFIRWSAALLDKLPAKLSVCDQLDRASTSVPLNIAEGNGKFTAPDRCRYLDSARGSVLECAACLDVLVAKGRAAEAEIDPGKQLLRRVVSLLVGLIRSNSPDRFREDEVPYRVGKEQD